VDPVQRITPRGMGYVVEIVYQKEVQDVGMKRPERIMGIDMGVRNIVTVGDSISKDGIAVRGGVLKSINQFFNKEYARLKSISDRQMESRSITKKEKKLFMVRNRKIKDIMHKLSKAIVQYARSRKIDTIIIGHNDGWKQNTYIGKRNNQNFVQLPFNMLIKQIRYKAEEIGINVILQDESHTSKCSFLDNESIEHQETYMGERIGRGVFRSKNGILIHADLYAAYNIIRKAVPEAFADGIGGIVLYQRSSSIPEFTGMTTSRGGC